jgi:uncharacterized phiE125 gp8 family phage protein
VKIIAPPVAEPLHITDAKLHLRLVAALADAAAYTREDDYLIGIIAAARQTAEGETWKYLVTQTQDAYFGAWPAVIKLPHPLRSVDVIEYTDDAGTVTAFTDYSVDYDGALIVPDDSWPSVSLADVNPIRVRYRVGYVTPFTADSGTDTLTALNHTYANGDTVRLSVSGGALPTGLSTYTQYYVVGVSGDDLQLSATSGGAAVSFSTAGSGTMFLGEIPPATIAGMKLVISGLYEERGEIIVGASVASVPRAASSMFDLDSAKGFV